MENHLKSVAAVLGCLALTPRASLDARARETVKTDLGQPEEFMTQGLISEDCLSQRPD